MRVLANVRIASFLLLVLLKSSVSQALPIGFGRNQGDLEYDELVTPNFQVYHDRRSPHEARVVLEALEAARPRLQAWLGVERKSALPVILSSTTSNASFANFITDAIELQTLSRGGRDLAWHEYTHSTMYRHLDNILGPAGSLLHLPWMPAWWIEGLAETMSVSGGSDMQYGIERYYSLRGGWPTYDKLHSLYDSNRFSQIGYAISGAFVSYILRNHDAKKLPQVLNDFYDYSMPWWWPWTFVPFNGFMPMDAALKTWTGKSGEELYEAYKKDAEAYWKGRSDMYHFTNVANKLHVEPPKEEASVKHTKPGQALTFQSTYHMQTRGDEIFFVNNNRGESYEAQVIWKDSGTEDFKRVHDFREGTLGPRIIRKDFRVTLTGDTNDNLEPIRVFWLERKGKRKRFLTRNAYVSDLMLAADKIIWFEEFLESQKLCMLPRAEMEKPKVNPKAVKCFYNVNYPRAMRPLGNKQVVDKNGEDLDSEIWLSLTEETLMGDRHGIVVIDTASLQSKVHPVHGRGKPIGVAFNKNGAWMALSDANHHFLRTLDANLRCTAEAPVANIIDRLFNSRGEYYTMSLWEAYGNIFVRLQNIIQFGACRTHDEAISPLLASMREPNLSLDEIMDQRDPWKDTPPQTVQTDAQKLASEPTMGNSKAIPQDVKSKPAGWHPRPVFGFPWIGIDAVGYQYGMISVPLMDHLQNETLQATTLYGVESRFPNIELNLLSTRFETTWSFDLFRRQTWNGVWASETYYFDERGASISAARYIRTLDLSLRVSYKESYLIPFLGDDDLWALIAKGYIRQTTIGLNRSDNFFWGNLGYYLNTDLATKFNNKNYDYDQVGGGLNLGIPISLLDRGTYMSYGVSYSRVRGTRRKLLKEAYRPLRTYVPGSGGGLNEINQPIFGPGALTSAVYGDTQARFNASWTFPIMPDLAKLIHIVYLQRLDFTAFFNYGNAWYYTAPPKADDAIKAHGYNLDLQADVKGVKLNAGLGVGQVFGQDWEMYALFGFDALIDQGNR